MHKNSEIGSKKKSTSKKKEDVMVDDRIFVKVPHKVVMVLDWIFEI